MVNHIFGENSYVEADYYTVVSIERTENRDPDYRPETNCYCGKDTVQIARVGFHTDTTEETPGNWPTTISQTLKAHRCDKHGFSESDR